MILACGVRFIRFRSSAVSGCASRSARAAASTAAGVMGLSVLLEVVILLILRRSAACIFREAILLERDIHFGVSATRSFVYRRSYPVKVQTHNPPSRVSKHDNGDLPLRQVL